MVSAKNNYLKTIGYLFLFVLITFFLAGCKIEGNVSEQGQGVKDVTANLTGTETSTTLTQDNGNFKFNYLDKGEYTVSLSKTGYTFEPVSQTVVIEGRFDVKTISFEAISNKIPIADPQNITLEEDSEISIVLTGSDQNNDPLTFNVQTNPEHGQLTGTAPDLTYTPSENYNGIDSFTFVANDGKTNSESAVITVEVTPVIDPPTVTLSADPTEINKGGMSTLTWTSTNGDTCTIEPNIGNVNPNGSIIVTPQETTTYTIIVSNADGTATDSVEITVLMLPEVSLSANPSTINLGDSSTLTWSSTNVDSCTIEPGIGSVNPNGSVTVSPNTTTTYTITASNSEGTITDTVEITVSNPPSVTLSANPLSINQGGTSTLTWTSTNADTCSIEPDIGNVELNGSIAVTIQKTTTYTITALNTDGPTTSSVEITIKIPPAVHLSVSETTINHGESVILTWSSSPAQKAYFNNAIGEVAPSGSMTLAPEYTTTYTITSVNDTLTSVHSISVKVLGHPPEPQPEGTFGKQYNDLIPSDASFESYAPDRFIVLTGFVEDISGNPVQDVKIEIIDHPEYGSALTDDTGRFSIPAEGGTLIKISYTKDNYLTVHRRKALPVKEIVTIDTITLLQRDTAETLVTFDGNPETIITHKSTEFTDESGPRSCTMVFTGDNKAYELDKYGNRVRELSSITTRATEYITPESMPSILPPTTAFTHCVELEAEGIERIEFDKPITNYVDNFLGFDVGEIVPVGYYDRDLAEWVASDNGVVVRLLDIDSDGIVDALDATGDDLPDDLNNDGSTTDEVMGLDSSYQPGKTYWRFKTKHLTPWDCNWAWKAPPDSITPNSTVVPTIDIKKDEPIDCKTKSGSYVEDRSRIMNEDIPVMGTGVKLHYSCDRVQGYKTIIGLAVSGDSVPVSLKRIIVKCEIAGLIMERTLDPLPNQKTHFSWNGLNYQGKTIKTPISANLNIGFVYDGVYSRADGNIKKVFARAGGTPTLIEVRQEVIKWKYDSIKIQQVQNREVAEGWTISSQHQLDVADINTLYKGDGTKIKNNSIIITTIAGTGNFGYSGDGGPATEADFRALFGIALDQRGNVFITDKSNHRIRKVDNKGIITTIAGNGNIGYSGDGGLATEASLSWPIDIALDQQENLFIVDHNNHRIRKVDTNGIITTIAGNGNNGYSGDDGLATEASFSWLTGIALDHQGNLFIADLSDTNSYIRKVDTNGIITTIAEFRTPRGIALDHQGNLFIADYYLSRIFKMDASGIITTIAGNGDHSYSGDGGPATEAALCRPYDISLDQQGNLFIADHYNDRIRKVDTSGIITTIAGNGNNGYSGDGGPATEAALETPTSIAPDQQGNLFIADHYNFRIRMVGYPSTFIGAQSSGDIPFTDKNGLGYIMDSTGKHKKTIDLDTGKILHAFEYQTFNDTKHLISITDQFGNTTTINRNMDGIATSIISPDGLETLLSIDSDNHLTSVTNPDNSVYNFSYTPGGSLTQKIEPNLNTYNYVYNADGRITETFDENGGHWLFFRSVDDNGTINSIVTSGEENTTTYKDNYFSTGKYTSEITGHTGDKTYYTSSADGLNVQKSLSCGMELDFKYDVDPEYKYDFVKEITKSTPSGLARITKNTKSYADTNSDDIPDLITKNISVNNKTASIVHNVLSSTKIITTPEGRQATFTYDPDTLVINTFSIPELNQTDYLYNTTGRIESITTGTRTVSYTYDSNGSLDSVTNPENHTISYAKDKAGRVTSVHGPDGSTLEFTYDKNGNITAITNPDTIDHLFGYNKVSLWNNYTTPLSGSYYYTYDKDKRLIQKDFPSGKAISFDYSDPDNLSDKSRLWTVTTPEGTINLTYSCSAKVESITKGTESINYTYDGSLITSEFLSGLINHTLSLTYNNDFNVETFTYAGDTVSYSYDNDGLLTGSGGYIISRNAQNGLPESLTDDTFTLNRTFNAYGELSQKSININGNNLFELNLATDNNGRITSKTETVEGTGSSYTYTYDQLGRLLTVTKDATLVEEYRYDLKGTRNYEMNTLRGITGRTFTYSDEDHLLTAGSNTYQYDLDGFLTSKTIGSDTTTYTYSSRGELLNVILPDSRYIEYAHDPTGRRIAKKIDGATTEKYLWAGQTTGVFNILCHRF